MKRLFEYLARRYGARRVAGSGLAVTGLVLGFAGIPLSELMSSQNTQLAVVVAGIVLGAVIVLAAVRVRFGPQPN